MGKLGNITYHLGAQGSTVILVVWKYGKKSVIPIKDYEYKAQAKGILQKTRKTLTVPEFIEQEAGKELRANIAGFLSSRDKVYRTEEDAYVSVEKEVK